MPLDDLVQVIETLQRRIRNHGDTRAYTSSWGRVDITG